MAYYGGSLDGVKIITLAPELSGAMKTIEWLSKEHKDIIIWGEVLCLHDNPLLGHSCASYKEAEMAMDSGVTLITHLFNAMPVIEIHSIVCVLLITLCSFTGIVGLITRDSDKQLYYGLIADGYHTSPNAIQIAYRANKNGLIYHLSVMCTFAVFLIGIVLVSDAAPTAGQPDGFYVIGDLPVEVKNGKCVMRDDSGGDTDR